jgi:hypothetical protein
MKGRRRFPYPDVYIGRERSMKTAQTGREDDTCGKETSSFGIKKEKNKGETK